MGVEHTLRHDAFGRRREARERDLGERLLVDGVVDRLADADVVERLLQHVEADIALDDRLAHGDVELGIGLKRRRLLVGQREGEVRFAGLQHGGAGVVFRHRFPGDGIDLRKTLLPIAVELPALDEVGLLPVLEHERAGADWMEGDVLAAPFGERRRRDHRRRGMGEGVDERAERLLEGDLDGMGSNRFDLGDTVELVDTQQPVLAVGNAVEIDLDGFGVEIGAVVELDALAQLERIDEAVVGDRVALGEHRCHLEVLVELEQALVESLGDRGRQRRVGVVGIERLRLAADGEDDAAGGERAARHGDAAERHQPGEVAHDLQSSGESGFHQTAPLLGGWSGRTVQLPKAPTACLATKWPGVTSWSGSTTGSSPSARIGLGRSSAASSRRPWRRAGSATGTAAMSLRV